MGRPTKSKHETHEENHPKLLKTNVKEKITKAARENDVTHKKKRWVTDFSSETIQAKRQWGNIFKVLEEKNCQPRILHVAKMSS